jgi:hypothetical protein
MLSDSRRQEIRERLWDQLDTARAAHHAASERFALAVKEGPAGLPPSDGVLHIQQAGADLRSALQHYMCALKRFTEFTLDGTIPEDLLPPD